MKAVLTQDRFDDPDWIYERKLDGIRCLAVRAGGPVQLWSRNDLSLNGRFPEIAAALETQAAARFVVDGEVVAMSGGQTSFSLLGQRGQRAVKVVMYVFDVLEVDEEDVRPLPLRERKRRLRALLDFDDTIRWTSYRNGDGVAFYEEACRRGWEGLIAKRADSPYATSRSKDWLKFKCEQGQELVVGGYTAPRGTREEFGALLLGYHDAGGALRYAGKVGTGFGGAMLRDLGERLRAIERPDSPFAEPVEERGATWVEPDLVAQVAFTEWTRRGRLRHPRFLGMRDDKPAREVVREG